jgi:hypothetical protein
MERTIKAYGTESWKRIREKCLKSHKNLMKKYLKSGDLIYET